MRAAPNLRVLADVAHAIATDAAVTLELSQGYRMLCRVDHVPVPRSGNGSIELARVRRVQVMEISHAAPR
jgi:hypothetical protein